MILACDIILWIKFSVMKKSSLTFNNKLQSRLSVVDPHRAKGTMAATIFGPTHKKRCKIFSRIIPA